MNSKQLTIRVGNNTLSFTMTDPTNAEQPVLHEPYVVKSGISMVANLREAFKTYARAIDLPTARVLINTPVLMVPIEQFQEADATTLYLHSFPRNHLHQRSFTGHRSKIYGYFHDKQLDICSFQQNRFKFCNSFETSRAHDSLYFLLYVWKQLNLKPEHDEIHILGDIPEQEWLLQEMRRYVKNAYIIPSDPMTFLTKK